MCGKSWRFFAIVFVATVLILFGLFQTVFAGKQDNSYGCETNIIFNTHRTQHHCWGSMRAWTAARTNGQDSLWIYEQYDVEGSDHDYAQAIDARYQGIRYHATLDPALDPLWNLLLGGFEGYFEVKWVDNNPAYSLTLTNGSQYHQYTVWQDYTQPPLCSNTPVFGRLDCSGSFRMFSEDTSPDTFEQFSKTITVSCTAAICRSRNVTETYKFRAQVANQTYACSPTDPVIKSLWDQALMTENIAWVQWSPDGECVFLDVDRDSTDILVN